MNIFVGGLPRATTESELRSKFEEHGEVSSVAIIKDKMTGESRGFGFVEMPSDSDAQSAIDSLNGTQMGGRTLTVNKARPREDRRGGGGGRGRGGGGGGRGRDRDRGGWRN